MNHGLTNALRWNKKNRHALTESKIYSLIEKIYASQSRKPFCGSVQTNLPRPANHRPFFRHPYYPPTPSLPIGRTAAVQLRATPCPSPTSPEPGTLIAPPEAQTTQKVHRKPRIHYAATDSTY